jgi:hypothetical protein
MRKAAILAGLVAGLLLLQASPAVAYKWKRTVKVGIDHNGVPIQIDARVVGAASTTGSQGGGGGGVPCRYHLASIGAVGPYQQAPSSDVLLYTIECGSWTDVRWLRVGPNGQPLVPGATVDPYQLALSVRDRLDLPGGKINANPARSLVGLDTWYWYEGYDGRPLSKNVSQFGVSVQVEARPTRYRWDFGDGTTLTSNDLGRPYPARSTVTHTYQTATPKVTVACAFDFAVRYRTGGGPWTPLPALRRTATASFEVAESQTVIGQ